MTTVVIAPYGVSSFPEAGGHFWVYLQYAAALRSIGCDVYWMEQFQPSGAEKEDVQKLNRFADRLRHFGFDRKFILYKQGATPADLEFINIQKKEAQQIFKRADLLINFHYTMEASLIAHFRKTAMVDIDPGLLQFWIANHQLTPARHDLYFTTGETVGTDRALFPDCDIHWIQIRPGIFLDFWPYVFDAACQNFTTVSSWWGKEYVTDGKDVLYENNKRVSFLEFIDLPHHTTQPLELALSFGDDEVQEREHLEKFGWRVAHAFQVANGPLAYQNYLQNSRGEFSCAKPSCMQFQNAWISDRTLCYLASGKPAVVQYTGPSEYLPNGEGLFRFSTLQEAVFAFEQINENYEKHCALAREIAESFDARISVETILNHAL